MNKENQMLIILSFIGIANIIAAIILLFTVENFLVSGLLIVSGGLLIVGGIADKKERKKRKGSS
ncbi:hypothetical protein GCM10010954_14720 [Halobacillus andaensis]|uniref:Uncharacterized protein n=1 Tax=Halobacillus andaensis TaxID=1176239 RepID=A0A917EWN4_HALAA|nr:hypothetical protein [Halobacillus andaensis]MBP2005027.1 hypothetical protein [Halobacillus andaensis]GGF17113.1 hypothetical protein GCM10010954_14720 [Halobacillus andaensis]